jgi:RecA/RadA recombinase
MEEVVEQSAFKITNCYNLALKQEFKLSAGCKIINDFLRGGFLPKRLYEIYGESGSGKTQLSIQLLLNVYNFVC